MSPSRCRPGILRGSLVGLLILAGFLMASGAGSLRAGLLTLPQFEAEPDQVAHLQRSLTLLGSSSREHPHRMRILVYGQSISLQSWWTNVARFLRETYPHADLAIENHAISGMQADYLSRTALADVIPFQPDLILFHAYGDEAGMDRFLSTVRSNTSCEILLQGDHIYDTNWVHEETDPSKVPSNDFWPYRNYVWLPRLAQKYGACLLPTRTLWRRYLMTNGLPEGALVDGVHLNDDGNLLLTELVKKYLAPREFLPAMDPYQCPKVSTLELGPSFGWESGVLEAAFTGNQITAIHNHASAAPIRVEIDGKDPASLTELHGMTRVSPTHFYFWPAILKVGHLVPLLEEEWTLRLTEMSLLGDRYSFEVSGSETGPDGTGNNLTRFVSNSGRVVIEPRDWMLGLAVYLAGERPRPAYRVRWQAVRHFQSELNPAFSSDPFREIPEVVASGLSDGPHRIRLIASDGVGGGIRALRTYSPSGKAALSPRPSMTLSRIGITNEIRLPAGRENAELEFSPTLGPGSQWNPVPNSEGNPSGTPVRRHAPPGDSGYYRISPLLSRTPRPRTATPPE
ncbi:MAG: SGNH/GDSL hydrolase family protein [Verrucomicrobiales bacterium]|nr:SGNH/GDSL hydrolase family protein [Verrucomicrobiales bacterium]